MVGQRALYPGNGAGDRSQSWSKVSSKVVLLKYSAIAIFAKIAIWRVFPDTVTISIVHAGENLELILVLKIKHSVLMHSQTGSKVTFSTYHLLVSQFSIL